MPGELGARHIFVNIPAFSLEVREQGRQVLDMRVVVGKRGKETPAFSSAMTHVVFSPYWNIPDTIVEGETLPALAKDPAYLERQNIDILRASNAGTEIVDASSVDWNDAHALQRLSFRQRPGTSNALGLVKFMFPNSFDVYIHDTPSVALFQRAARALSHGCVRIQDPRRLAAYVLRDQPQWTSETIERAMRAGTEQHVKLSAPLPVHIAYFTVWVDREGGLRFLSDVYGYDVKTDRAQPNARPTSDTALLGGAKRIS
jgi:murein L,D-transpeptidase YcbB/YkuD